jgi:hypothetical protein
MHVQGKEHFREGTLRICLWMEKVSFYEGKGKDTHVEGKVTF